MSETAEPNWKIYSPQLVRLLHLAEMEAKRLDGKGVVVQPEHVLIASMQDADDSNGIYVLLTNANMSIQRLRLNDYGQPPPMPQK